MFYDKLYVYLIRRIWVGALMAVTNFWDIQDVLPKSRFLSKKVLDAMVSERTSWSVQCFDEHTSRTHTEIVATLNSSDLIAIGIDETDVSISDIERVADRANQLLVSSGTLKTAVAIAWGEIVRERIEKNG